MVKLSVRCLQHMCKAIVKSQSQVLTPQLMACFFYFLGLVCLFIHFYYFVCSCFCPFVLFCLLFLLLFLVLGGEGWGWGDAKLQLAVVGKLNGWVLELNFAGQIINFKSLFLLNWFFFLFVHLHLFIFSFIYWYIYLWMSFVDFINCE